MAESGELLNNAEGLFRRHGRLATLSGATAPRGLRRRPGFRLQLGLWLPSSRGGERFWGLWDSQCRKIRQRLLAKKFLEGRWPLHRELPTVVLRTPEGEESSEDSSGESPTRIPCQDEEDSRSEREWRRDRQPADPSMWPVRPVGWEASRSPADSFDSADSSMWAVRPVGWEASRPPADLFDSADPSLWPARPVGWEASLGETGSADDSAFPSWWSARAWARERDAARSRLFNATSVATPASMPPPQPPNVVPVETDFIPPNVVPVETDAEWWEDFRSEMAESGEESPTRSPCQDSRSEREWRRDRQLEAEGWEDLRSEMAESGELWCEEVGWGH